MRDSIEWVRQELSDTAKQMRTVRVLRNKLKFAQTQRDQTLQAVGAMVYATHTGTPTDSDEMVEKLTELDGYYSQIHELEDKLRYIQAKAVCTKCGTPTMERTAFCQHCGAKL